ncbi:MAG: hypothetical protein LBQ15_04385 [Clostridium sp.]|nr:hypothetical protein [Clostridium sp.]
MTEEQKQILKRIQDYAEAHLGEIEPQKVPVSAQLQTLRPVMQQIAAERSQSLEEVFILYMDLQSEASCQAERKLQEEFRNCYGIHSTS